LPDGRKLTDFSDKNNRGGAVSGCFPELTVLMGPLHLSRSSAKP